ncbi:hypothetical protein CEXT_117691 [Caerostris extrusa]|uniref:Uncharacterized protein n=1 Tax=Caerostris extrusa TaxID=172846 RepID=A0AAV4R0E7_CAEEX|nr:hypothetical protein CEXT_117691 [Caerostris extrusa]
MANAPTDAGENAIYRRNSSMLPATWCSTFRVKLAVGYDVRFSKVCDLKNLIRSLGCPLLLLVVYLCFVWFGLVNNGKRRQRVEEDA